uniref:Uncharacterized protein n=1 Tax=Romanomermis culicivorax TaxID=13658 RepID=A0A915J1P3_ROMCU
MGWGGRVEDGGSRDQFGIGWKRPLVAVAKLTPINNQMAWRFGGQPILRSAYQIEPISELYLGDGIFRRGGHPSDGYVDSLSNLLFVCLCNFTSGVDGLKLPDGSTINSSEKIVRVNDKFPLGSSFGCICGGVLENKSLIRGVLARLKVFLI